MDTAQDIENDKIIPFPSPVMIQEDKTIDNKTHLKLRIIKDRLFKYIVIVFSLLSFLPLLLILFHITKNGISVINWSFLTELPKPIGEIGGGIYNSIIGSLMLILLSSIISIPLGIS
ncbi:MAG TPA: hypothetical protein PLM71_10655, partial [Syntrophorhabdaceae bacterium]|nr:hypothetical protein [Syntrophorhabdaceae bacterium]